ncbi:MAG: hypothetical protein IPK96_12445 [Flammeovirgaceae bacterium]|nr:hypothetical protein [Flammeovirgaceae bacterium]
MQARCLAYGGIGNLPVSIRELVSLIRVYKGDRSLIIHNVSDVEITTKLESELNEFTSIDYKTNERVTLDGNTLVIPAYASVIMK